VIVVAGEALIDLAPRGEQLLPLPGGSPYNVAVGLGRLGRDVGYLGALSNDGFGRRLAARLEAEDVDLSLAATTDAPTTLAVVHLDDQGRASYGFYLEGTSATGLSPADLRELPPAAPLHVSFGAVSAASQPAGRTLTTLLTAAAGQRLTSLDPNVRPSVIPDLAAYAADLERLLANVDLVKVSDEDLHLLHPTVDDPLDVGRRWASLGCALVVVTLGPDGALALRPDGTEVAGGGIEVEVVDTVGAGDAFTSGLLGGLDARGVRSREALADLDDDAIRAVLGRAVEVAAITCTRAGSDPPRLDELSGTLDDAG
jgi:fructokinase